MVMLHLGGFGTVRVASLLTQTDCIFNHFVTIRLFAKDAKNNTFWQEKFYFCTNLIPKKILGKMRAVKPDTVQHTVANYSKVRYKTSSGNPKNLFTANEWYLKGNRIKKI